MTIKAKKISTIICSLIILLSLYVTPVSAASGARGTICPGCSGNMLPSRTYGTWTPYQKTCSHGYTYGTDKMEQRTVTTVVKCTRCGLAYPPTTSTQTRFVSCHGYN